MDSQNSGEVIEKRSDTPKLLELFPWETKKVLKAGDLSPNESLELSFIETQDYIVQHLDNLVATNMINYGEQISIKICDMDTNMEHNVSLRKTTNTQK